MEKQVKFRHRVMNPAFGSLLMPMSENLEAVCNCLWSVEAVCNCLLINVRLQAAPTTGEAS